MSPESIVAEICNQADDFLAGVTKREEARAGIAEWLTIHHAQLSPSERTAIVKASFRVLESEAFFSADPGGD